MIRCHACGAEFLPNCLRCSMCGTPWDKNAPPYQPPAPEEAVMYPAAPEEPPVFSENIWQEMEDQEATIALFRSFPPRSNSG